VYNGRIYFIAFKAEYEDTDNFIPHM